MRISFPQVSLGLPRKMIAKVVFHYKLNTKIRHVLRGILFIWLEVLIAVKGLNDVLIVFK